MPHRDIEATRSTGQQFVTSAVLMDAFERRVYAKYSGSQINSINIGSPTTCDLIPTSRTKTHCSSKNEWDAFVAKYMAGIKRMLRSKHPYQRGYNAQWCLDRVGRPSQSRNGDMPDAIQSYSSGSCRGQINIPTPDKGAAIVNANRDASPVTDAN